MPLIEQNRQIRRRRDDINKIFPRVVTPHRLSWSAVFCCRALCFLFAFRPRSLGYQYARPPLVLVHHFALHVAHGCRRRSRRGGYTCLTVTGRRNQHHCVCAYIALGCATKCKQVLAGAFSGTYAAAIQDGDFTPSAINPHRFCQIKQTSWNNINIMDLEHTEQHPGRV